MLTHKLYCKNCTRNYSKSFVILLNKYKLMFSKIRFLVLLLLRSSVMFIRYNEGFYSTYFDFQCLKLHLSLKLTKWIFTTRIKLKNGTITQLKSNRSANYLIQSLESVGITKELWEQKAKVDFGKELDAEIKAWKNLWSAGQGVATIKDSLSVSELISNMQSEYIEALKRQSQLIKHYIWIKQKQS